ncbi:MAG: hypothetical protein ONB24_09565 [candidate division KSB1 bacterium]|nr:hypothetical protein [candidate division KSB1 bacterium]
MTDGRPRLTLQTTADLFGAPVILQPPDHLSLSLGGQANLFLKHRGVLRALVRLIEMVTLQSAVSFDLPADHEFLTPISLAI